MPTTKSDKPKRILSAAARAAMSAGGKKAQAGRWGAVRGASVQVRVNADIADRLAREIPARFRRDVASRGIDHAIDIYLAREASKRRAANPV